MSYDDLIKLYPWVDLIMELFKGIVPTFVALLAIFLNNFFSQKRDLLYRKKSLQLDYCEKMLQWLHEIKKDMMEITLELENALSRRNPEERVERYNNFLKYFSDMNKIITVWSDTYNMVFGAFGCDIEFDQFKKKIIENSDDIIRIGQKYIRQSDTEMATDEINNVVCKSNKVIDENITVLLKKMSKLY